LFTASSKPEDEISELIKKGAHSCLKKPIDPDELLNYLEGLKS
jgi:CheY-like chemotaxis protein